MAKKKNNVPVSVVIFLLAVALVFGGAVGFLLGRGTVKKKEPEIVNGVFEIWEDENIWENAVIDSSSGTWGDTSQWGVDEWATLLPWDSVNNFGESEIAVLYDGGCITANEVKQYYADNEDNYLLQNKGLEDAMYDLTKQKILYKKAEECGCTELTEQDEREIAQTAQAEYAAMENRPADVTVASIAEILRDSWWMNKIYAVMDAEEISDATLSEDEKREAVLQKWTEEAHTEYYPENLVVGW